MTKAEMEEAIRNHDRRLVNVEQILPTLATRADLAELKRHTSVQFETLRDDIRMLAEALAAIPARFDAIDARFDRLERRANATAMSLEHLTLRLTERGVI